MSALPQDEAGEIGRMIDVLTAALERVKAKMEKGREAKRVNDILDSLEACLTVGEFALVRDSLPLRENINIDGLRLERDALAKAIDALKAKLHG